MIQDETFQKALDYSNKQNEVFFREYTKKIDEKLDSKLNKLDKIDTEVHDLAEDVKKILYEMKSDPENGRVGVLKQVHENTSKLTFFETEYNKSTELKVPQRVKKNSDSIQDLKQDFEKFKEFENFREQENKRIKKLMWTAITTSGAAIGFLLKLYYQK